MFLIIIAIPLQLLLDIDMLYFKGVVRYCNGIAMFFDFNCNGFNTKINS